LQLGERCRGLLLRPSGAFQLELGLPPGLRLGVPRRGGRVQHGQGFGQLRLRCLVVLVQRRELLPVLSRGGRGRLGRRGRHECAHRSVTGDCPVQQHAELEAACERVDRDAHVEQVRVGGVVAGLAHLVHALAVTSVSTPASSRALIRSTCRELSTRVEERLSSCSTSTSPNCRHLTSAPLGSL